MERNLTKSKDTNHEISGDQTRSDETGTDETGSCETGSCQTGSCQTGSEQEEVNVVYFAFCVSFVISLVTVLLFWVDLIPGFGTAKNISNLWEE